MRNGASRAAWGIALSVVILAVAFVVIAYSSNPAVRIATVVAGVLALVVLWGWVARSARGGRALERRFRAEHPGAHVERVLPWAIDGRRTPGEPALVAVASPDGLVLFAADGSERSRIAPDDVTITLERAIGDRAGDDAVTISDGAGSRIQLFTITNLNPDGLARRLSDALEPGRTI